MTDFHQLRVIIERRESTKAQRRATVKHNPVEAVGFT